MKNQQLSLTVILTVYKRPKYLAKQIKAIENQTIKPSDIWIWYNKPEGEDFQKLDSKGYTVIRADENYKFHARFAFGLLSDAEYLAFFDDDTIPGRKWFENCLNTINSGYDGILGTSGILLKDQKYTGCRKIGWNGEKYPYVTKVDLVGHAWFLRREYLKYLWYEPQISYENGEDIQLSYLCQKYGNINTYVPPHHKKQMQTWGSIKGNRYGDDIAASYKKKGHYILRNKIVSECIKRGWKPIK